MINHARTLLCNVSGASRPGLGMFGEEYVPANFVAQTLPGYLANLRTIIFGTDPDNLFLNYRAAECMHLLHSTKFVTYLTDLDTRYTYDLADRSFFDTDFGTNLVTIQAVTDLIPSVLNRFVCNDAKGRAMEQWDVRIAGGTVTRKNIRTGATAIDAWALADSLSPRYSLPGSDLDIRFITPGALLGDGRWQVTAAAKPAGFYGLEAKLQNSGQAASALLFSETEPYKTFKNLWEQHPLFNHRMSGMLLAMIYRMEAIRNA